MNKTGSFKKFKHGYIFFICFCLLSSWLLFIHKQINMSRSYRYTFFSWNSIRELYSQNSQLMEFMAKVYNIKIQWIFTTYTREISTASVWARTYIPLSPPLQTEVESCLDLILPGSALFSSVKNNSDILYLDILLWFNILRRNVFKNLIFIVNPKLLFFNIFFLISYITLFV